MKQKIDPDQIVVKRAENALIFEEKKMRKYTCYPVRFYGLKLTAMRTNDGIELFIDEYPKKIEKFEGIKEIKHKEHVTENGCLCEKCKSMTTWHRNYLRRSKKC